MQKVKRKRRGMASLYRRRNAMLLDLVDVDLPDRPGGALATGHREEVGGELRPFQRAGRLDDLFTDLGADARLIAQHQRDGGRADAGQADRPADNRLGRRAGHLEREVERAGGLGEVGYGTGGHRPGADVREYFVDAHTGVLRFDYSDLQSQSAVGRATGVKPPWAPSS